MIRPWPTALLLLPAAAACSMRGDKAPFPALVRDAPAAPPPRHRDRAWQDVISPDDRERLRGWRSAWTTALTKVRKAGHGRPVAMQVALLVPDAALANPAPPPGDYRCRVIKLGARDEGLADYIPYPYFSCKISAEGSTLNFAKLDGSQRPAGTFYPAQGNRMIFLGAMALGDERRAPSYGYDAERDLPGLVERVSARQWRIVLPYPRWESTLDIIELIPKN
jgi:hypothetical protein